MKLIWLMVINGSNIIRIPRMNDLTKMRLKRCLCTCLVFLLVSCASSSRETYLASNSLASIKKVAILASTTNLDVAYDTQGTRAQGGLAYYLLGGPVGLVAGMIIEGAIKGGVASAQDAEHAKEIETKVALSSIEDKIVQAFTTPIRKASCFDHVDYIKGKINGERQLSDADYDAVIRLDIKSISLTHIEGGNVNLEIAVQGQLTNVRSGKIMWDRLEVISLPKLHDLNYYKANGLKDLSVLLEKAGQNLAYDLVYVK